jgi:hypothetical protein
MRPCATAGAAQHLRTQLEIRGGDEFVGTQRYHVPSVPYVSFPNAHGFSLPNDASQFRLGRNRNLCLKSTFLCSDRVRGSGLAL